MADNQGKRRRNELFAQLLHTGQVTTRALTSIISQIRSQPELLDANRNYLQRANLEAFTSIRHEEQLPLRDGSVFKWEMCNPNRLLAKMIEECPHLQELYVRAANKHPCSASQPWSLVIGFDEFCPGNKLKVHNERKCMNLSFNFLELGVDVMWHESTWMTPICVRHAVIAKVPGGWSRMFRQYLRLQLLGDTGISTAGLPLMLAGKPFLLFAKLRHVIADGDGFRMLWDWKGANGLKPCFRHSNVLSKGSDISSRDPAFVEISCADHDRFQTALASDVSEAVDVLLEAHRRVSAGTMTKTRFADLQKVYGLNCSPDGVLADFELRECFDAVKVTTVDWVHSTMQDGTMTTETFLFVSACESAGLTTLHDLEVYMRSDRWQFPAALRARNRALYHVFESCRSPSHDRFKCSCSEMLAVYGFIRHYVQTRCNTPELAMQRASFEACCKVLDVIVAAKRCIIPMQQSSALLYAALSDHMRKHLAAYGDENIKPKHHWMFDVAEQMLSMPCVLDAFIVERLHLRVKSIAAPVLCTSSFERSVLAGVMTSQRSLLNAADFRDGLRGKIANFPGSDALVADRLEFKGVAAAFGDIIYAADAAGQIIACVLEDNALFVVVEAMEFVENVSLQSAKWRCTRNRKVWRAESIQLALAWYSDGDMVMVLRA